MCVQVIKRPVFVGLSVYVEKIVEIFLRVLDELEVIRCFISCSTMQPVIKYIK